MSLQTDPGFPRPRSLLDRLSQAVSRDPFALSGPVGRLGENRREDVIKAQILLANAGYHDLAKPGAPTGWPGGGLERGIRRYQKAKGLTVDGVLLPMPDGGIGQDGAGETLAALKGELAGRLDGYAAPTPDEIDAFHAGHARNDADAPPPSNIITPSIVTPDATGQAKHPIGVLTPASDRIVSDVPDAAPVLPKPGQQEAFLPAALVPLAEAAITYAPLIIGGAYAAKQIADHQRNLPAAPTNDEITQKMEQRRADTQARWTNLRDRIGAFDSNQAETALNAPEAAAFTPLPDAVEPLKGRRAIPVGTPPLKGRPAEPAEPTVAQLIPPETQEWIAKLPPSQQPTAKELTGLIVEAHGFGPRGMPETRKANNIAAKACMATLGEFPRLKGFDHVFGGNHYDSGDYLKEIT